MSKKFIDHQKCRKGLHPWEGPNDYRVEFIQDRETGAIYSVRRCRACQNEYHKTYNKRRRTEKRERELRQEQEQST